MPKAGQATKGKRGDAEATSSEPENEKRRGQAQKFCARMSGMKKKLTSRRQLTIRTLGLTSHYEHGSVKWQARTYRITPLYGAGSKLRLKPSTRSTPPLTPMAGQHASTRNVAGLGGQSLLRRSNGKPWRFG